MMTNNETFCNGLIVCHLPRHNVRANRFISVAYFSVTTIFESSVPNPAIIWTSYVNFLKESSFVAK